MASSPPSNLQRIGPYRITGTLGSGGMGTVYKAVQESLDRTIALKVVNPASAADPRFQGRFLQEARAMAQVHSPFVVGCYDAGYVDGQLYMALELVTGGDLLGLMERKGGKLGEQLALSLLRDCFEGLEAVEAARLIHRDLKPANIFLSDRGTAKLADLGLARSVKQETDRATMAGMILGTPAYISPEQARGEDDLDIRTDIYSLGASLFHLVTGTTPYPASDPLGTLVRVLNDPVPDPRERNPEVSAPVAALIQRLIDKERTKRPISARAARDLVEALLRARPSHTPREDRTPLPTPVLPEQPAKSPSSTILRRPVDALTPRESPIATQTESPKTTRALPRIDPAQLAQLSKRIVVDQEGLRASLALAPGASFPRALLDQLLAVSSISHGLIEENLVAAGKSVELPRRITLAKGDPATPDAPGRNVMGFIIPPLDRSVVIRLSEDLMSAWALYRPGKPPTEEEIRAALAEANVTAGLDSAALAKFRTKPPSGGKLTVAKGRPPRQPIDAGFTLTVGPEGDLGLCPVEPGLIIAQWHEAEAGEAGFDVLGHTIAVPEAREPDPANLQGCGVEQGRTRDGDLCLRATRPGVVQRQADGMVRVVGVLEVPGDLAPGTPISTDDVVVVRGNVLAGSQLASTSDIVIIGDVSDAKISAGGDLEIRGDIAAGEEIRAAGTVVAAGACDRKILAGNIRISGTLRGCDLTATGAIVADAVVGGSLAAGGDISVGTLGDASGVPTVLWAGHHLSLDRQSDLIKLEEARHDAKRRTLVTQGVSLANESEDLSKRTERLAQSAFVKDTALKSIQDRLKSVSQQQDAIRREAESERIALLHQRRKREEMEQGTAAAKIAVGTVAYDGVTVRVGNREPVLLTEPRVRPTF
jgi:serine/threonine-protein kinase